MHVNLINGDCLEEMRKLPDNSVDSVVTDPPYGLQFMGKAWDYDVPQVDVWREAIRVLKPGGHLLSFCGTRTYHRMAVNIEDAGFEIRDMVEWVYGSGFPKSLNIGKAVDKLQGNEREVVALRTDGAGNGNSENVMYDADHKFVATKVFNETKGTSEWEGWGTALKPAHEPICMARKPLAEKTVAENVLKYGTGGINIDGSRVETSDNLNGGAYSGGERSDGDWKDNSGFKNDKLDEYQQPQGRFPANLIHDNSEEVRECFPETGKSTGGRIGNKGSALNMMGQDYEAGDPGYGDSGNASRFFKSIIYQAKASKSERNKGCEELEAQSNMRVNAPRENEEEKTSNKMGNHHPTIKPVALMEYLIKMITPEGGTVLDPYMGSGSTGVAAKNLNRPFVGIERDVDYFEIAKKRIDGMV